MDASREAKDPLVPATGDKGSFGIYGNGQERAEMDGNGWKQTQTQARSGVKIYLKAKTYD